VGTGSSGGYLVSQSFSDTLYATMKAYDPLFDSSVVTMIESDSGAAIPIPIG
jgi:HK97 family phage major capsid protein